MKSLKGNLSASELNAIMGGPSRRTDIDHVGAYNFKYEAKPTNTVLPVILKPEVK